jgi:hypothetical protein
MDSTICSSSAAADRSTCRPSKERRPFCRSGTGCAASRGLAVPDYNNDGAMDIAIVDHGEGVRLLRNDVPHGNWVELRLHSHVPASTAPLGFGDGATAVAWVGGTPLRRTVTSASYLSQDSHRVHIGLGSAKQVDRLEVPQQFRGPALRNFDMALIKNTRLAASGGAERATLQFRAEFFNVFNLVNFGLPSNVVLGPGFGEISRTAGSSRQIQFSLKLIY